MRGKRYSEEQIIRILRGAESFQGSVESYCKKQGISEQTFYRWRKKYGGMDVSEARRLKELELENTRLKKLLAERDLEIEIMKESKKVVATPTRRNRVQLAVGRGLSIRKACWLIGISRTCFHYRPKHAARGGRVLGKLKRFSEENKWWGYRFASAVLRRSDENATPKRIYRLWRRAGLQVPYRRRRRRIRTGETTQPVANGANKVWAWDFVFDRCANGHSNA